jgi:pyruvate/2-oxoglutarate dehydrogenase complex dihydrolipoamide acyltransferase (E2) component
LRELRLPQFGMGMQDGTVVKWHKREGDRVGEGEVLLDVEAAKANVEVQSPCTGVLRQILVAQEQNVPVQTVLALIDDEV